MKEKFDSLITELQAVIEEQFTDVQSFITMMSVVRDGMDHRKMFCQKCGTIEYVPITNRYAKFTYACPKCGNDKIAVDIHQKTKGQMYARLKEDGSFEGCVFRVEYYFPYEYDEEKHQNRPWQQSKPDRALVIDYVFKYDDKKGIRFARGNSSTQGVVNRNSQDYRSKLYALRSLEPAAGMSKTEWKRAIKAVNAFEMAREEKQNARRNALIDNLKKDPRLNYKATVLDEKDILAPTYSYLSYLHSKDDDGVFFKVVCTKCGQEFMSDDSSKKCKCPNCDNEEREFPYPVSSWHKSSNAHAEVCTFENTNLPENDLLVRLFRVNTSYDKEHGFQRNVVETQRIFLGTKILVYGCASNEKLDKATIRDISYSLTNSSASSKASIIQSNEKIRDIIMSSCLKYAGLVEAWGIGNSIYQQVEKLPDLRYIMAWYKNNNMEMLAKSNIVDIARTTIEDPSKLLDGKTLEEILGVHKFTLRTTVKERLNYNQMIEFDRLYKEDNSLTYEIYNAIKETGVALKYMIRLRKEFGVSYNKTLDYLQSCYDHQCIMKSEAISLWTDYLSMATNIGINLTDKTRKFPTSLKKEHDIAVFAYKAIQVEMDKKQFERQAKINSYYEYTYKDLMAVVPKTPQQIVEEATNQHNCLRSYIERVKNGDTVVVFIRKKDEPYETYVTAEVYDSNLTQLKGYCNSNPKDKDLMEFVAHWTKSKSIRIKC